MHICLFSVNIKWCTQSQKLIATFSTIPFRIFHDLLFLWSSKKAVFILRHDWIFDQQQSEKSFEWTQVNIRPHYYHEQIRASVSFIFVLFHSNYNYRFNFNTTNYIKYGWCARDFNPWPQNRRNRHNLGTMAAANFTYANKKGKIYRIFNTSY